MISSADIADNLAQVGVRSPPALIVHSSVRACLRVAGATVLDKLETIVEGLSHAVGAGALVMPTFTYSFCNDEPFEIAQAPSTVGFLTEYFRCLPDVRRTNDPIFSSAVRGPIPSEWEKRLFAISDVDCFGEHSIFSYLREVNASFVFFGVNLEACTFVHYVEQRHGVDYRYKKDFHGVVDDGSRRTPVTASYFVRPLDGSVEVFLRPLEDSLLAAGWARTITLPGGPQLLVTDARSIESLAVARMQDNPRFLLRSGHEGSDHSGDAPWVPMPAKRATTPSDS